MYKGGQYIDEIDTLAGRLATEACLAGVSIGFAAVSVDDDRIKASKVAPSRWPNLQHLHLPAESIHQLGVSIVPNRLVIDCRCGAVVKWWDGTHGKVLKGNHGLSRSNGSHDLLGELIGMEVDEQGDASWKLPQPSGCPTKDNIGHRVDAIMVIGGTEDGERTGENGVLAAQQGLERDQLAALAAQDRLQGDLDVVLGEAFIEHAQLFDARGGLLDPGDLHHLSAVIEGRLDGLEHGVHGKRTRQDLADLAAVYRRDGGDHGAWVADQDPHAGRLNRTHFLQNLLSAQ